MKNWHNVNKCESERERGEYYYFTILICTYIYICCYFIFVLMYYIYQETINLILSRVTERSGSQAVKKYLEIKNKAGIPAYSEQDMELHFKQHEVW